MVAASTCATADMPALRRSIPSGDNRAIHFVLRIDNLPHVRRAFGPEAARAAVVAVQRMLVAILRDDGVVVPDSEGQFDLLLCNPELLGPLPRDLACAAWVHAFCAERALVPIDCGGQALHLVMSGDWTVLPADLASPACGTRLAAAVPGSVRPFAGDAIGHGEAWCARYRQDMAAAAGLFAALAARRSDTGFAARPDAQASLLAPRAHPEIALAWQPIGHAGDASGILYHECLIRLVDADGNGRSPEDVVASLERLGLIRALDQFVVTSVIDELERQPDIRLAANISAQSAVADGWWRQIERRLAADRSVAQRLVIEITESAAIPCIASAVAFVARMRALGCLIALDDFGAGFASVRQLLALAPDIAKVDRLFVGRAAISRQARAAFEHLVGLAQAVAPIVIVEGIETAEQSALALEAGAVWQQGYHHGQPSLARNWRWSAPAILDAPWHLSGDQGRRNPNLGLSS